MSNSAPIPMTFHPDGDMTMTITTLNRLGALRKTLEGFFENVPAPSLARISKLIIIDDGSSKADRRAMRAMAPRATFVMKSPGTRGHMQSINMIPSLVKTPYWVQWEDDWVVEPGAPDLLNLGVKAMELSGAPHVTLSGAVNGGDGVVNHGWYSVQIYPRAALDKLDDAAVANGASGLPWPLFTLNPGLNDMAKLRPLFPFVEPKARNKDVYWSFETEFAARYAKTFGKKAVINNSHVRHLDDIPSVSAAVNSNATVKKRPQWVLPVAITAAVLVLGAVIVAAVLLARRKHTQT